MKFRIFSIVLISLLISACGVDNNSSPEPELYIAKIPGADIKPSYSDYSQISIRELDHTIASYFWRYAPWEYDHMMLLDRVYSSHHLRWADGSHPVWGNLTRLYQESSRLEDRFEIRDREPALKAELTRLANELTDNHYVVFNDLRAHTKPYNFEKGTFTFNTEGGINRDTILRKNMFKDLRIAFIDSAGFLKRNDRFTLKVDEEKAREIEAIRVANPHLSRDSFVIHLYGRVSHVAVVGLQGTVKVGTGYQYPTPTPKDPTMVVDVHRIDVLNRRTGEIYLSVER